MTGNSEPVHSKRNPGESHLSGFPFGGEPKWKLFNFRRYYTTVSAAYAREKFTTASFSYRELYTKAFAKLADISQQAEEAMQALEELQLVMGDQ